MVILPVTQVRIEFIVQTFNPEFFYILVLLKGSFPNNEIILVYDSKNTKC